MITPEGSTGPDRLDPSAGSPAENRDRQQVEAELRESEARYRMLHESMRDAFVQVDMEGRVIAFNELYCQMLGYSPEEVRQLTYQDLTPEQWHTFEARIVGEQIIARGYSDVYEKEYRRKDGTVFPVELRTILSHDAAGRPIAMWAFVRDITERKQAEKALREVQERLQIALDATQLGIHDYDVTTGTIQWDNRIREMWGVGPDESITYDVFLSGIHPEERAATQAAVERAFDPQGSGKYYAEFRVIHRITQQVRWIAATGIVFFKNQQAVRLVGTAQDITDLRRLEEERVEAMTHVAVQRRLMEQRENDRLALARDLHDGPIQTLSSSLFNLHMIKEAFPDPTLKNELNLIGQDIKRTIHELRGLLNELRPPALVHFGLSKVMLMFLEDFKSRFPEIEMVVEIAEEDHRLSNDAHLTLFRLFQEGMNNIVRHSEASKVWVAFRLEPDCCMLIVRDNGKGFQPKQDFSQLTRTGHFGMVGMKERAEIIGGELNVNSEPGNGTTITVRVPLPPISPKH